MPNFWSDSGDLKAQIASFSSPKILEAECSQSSRFYKESLIPNSTRVFLRMGILHFITGETIVCANSASARRNYRWIHQPTREEALTSTCLVRGVGREARNAAGNTKATLQKEPMVTEVTPVSSAALQTPPRAGYRREDTLNEAQRRRKHPASATRDKELESARTTDTWPPTAVKENFNSF